MTFNQAQFAAIVAQAKAKASNSPRWLRAIDRAAQALQSGELCVTLLQHDALVTSPRDSYFVNGHCQCEASRRGHAECYHRAAVRLTEMLESSVESIDSTDAESVATKAATSRADIIADIKAAWSRRFPTDSLADELMRRFRVNYLEALAEDMLRGVLAAIA
jgi:hypothetical protein